MQAFAASVLSPPACRKKERARPRNRNANRLDAELLRTNHDSMCSNRVALFCGNTLHLVKMPVGAWTPLANICSSEASGGWKRAVCENWYDSGPNIKAAHDDSRQGGPEPNPEARHQCCGRRCCCRVQGLYWIGGERHRRATRANCAQRERTLFETFF